jgi:hypothetical protein
LSRAGMAGFHRRFAFLPRASAEIFLVAFHPRPRIKRNALISPIIIR